MKKLLIILAVGTLMVSCQWWHETFSSPEKCAQWYCDEMLDALKDGDAAKALELRDDAQEWYTRLNPEDQERANKARKAWGKLHADEIKKYDI